VDVIITSGEVEAYISAFTPLTIYGKEQSVSPFCRLNPGKRNPLPIGKVTQRGPEMVWILWKGEKSFAARILLSLVTTPAELPSSLSQNGIIQQAYKLSIQNIN